MEKTDTLSYKFSAGVTSSQGTSGGFNLTDIEEQWQKIQDAAERRKIQNRNAQRKYRKNLKRRVEDLERQSMYRTYNSGSGSGSASTTSTSPSLSLEQHKKPGTSSSMEEDCSKLEANNSQGMVLRNGLIGAGSENNTPSQEIGNPMNSSGNDWICHRDQSNPSTIHTLLNQSPDLTRNYMDQTSQDHHMQNSTSFIDMSSINDYIHANNSLIEDLEEHLGSPESNSEDNLRMHNLGVYKSQRPRSTPTEFDLTVHMGSNPLHLAAMGGYHEIVSLLIDRGSDINARNNQGWTALHLAAERGQHEVVKVLIEKGADLFSRI